METYVGMSNESGVRMGDEAHLRQSIRDIVMTPIGSRVMRRDYGCGLFYLLDQPINGMLVAMAQAQIANALIRWEPRVRFSRVKVSSMEPGHLVLEVTGIWIENNRSFNMAGIHINR